MLEKFLDTAFPPSLARITRDFERTRSRLEAFSHRTEGRGFALREQASDLLIEADALAAEAARANRIATKLTDLTN